MKTIQKMIEMQPFLMFHKLELKSSNLEYIIILWALYDT